MARYTRPSFETATAFAAAAAAHRVNGGYIKQDVTTFHDEGGYTVEKVANKKLIRQFLTGDFDITDADREMGEKVRQHCHGLSFKIITGATLSDFEIAMLRIAETEKVDSNYDLAVIASLPATFDRAQIRQAQNVRLREAAGTLSNAVGTKVELDIEVVRCNFSNQWETFFVTAIVDNAVVFFAQKKAIEVGSAVRIKGKVKDHKADRTQLSHVKVL